MWIHGQYAFFAWLANEENIPELGEVLAYDSRNGKTAEVKAILTKYGHEKLSQVVPKDYEAILKDAEVLK